MATDPVDITNPQRWDVPFGQPIADADVEALLTVPPFNRLDPKKFPATLPLRGILQLDARLVHCQRRHHHALREDRQLRVLRPDRRRSAELAELPASLLGRNKTQKKGFFQAVAQLGRTTASRKSATPPATAPNPASPSAARTTRCALPPGRSGRARQVSNGHPKAGQMFGEGAAGRARTATAFAEGNVTLLEMRWQGLATSCRDEGLKQHVDQIFREQLTDFLATPAAFRNLDPESLAQFAAHALAAYGRYDRAGTLRAGGGTRGTALDLEAIIAEEGTPPVGLLMVRSGLVRLEPPGQPRAPDRQLSGPRTHYGLDELADNSRGPIAFPWNTRLHLATSTSCSCLRGSSRSLFSANSRRARSPCRWPRPRLRQGRASDAAARGNRHGFARIPGGKADHQRHGVHGDRPGPLHRCDDCVRACAAPTTTTRAPPPRAGEGRHGGPGLMHCLDPVCMIECPTGAIHRNPASGFVLINEGDLHRLHRLPRTAPMTPSAWSRSGTNAATC